MYVCFLLILLFISMTIDQVPVPRIVRTCHEALQGRAQMDAIE